MEDRRATGTYDFHPLEWDTDYFGVSCAKAVLFERLEEQDRAALLEGFDAYDFVSIENRNADSVNTQWIGRHTHAFLADVNLQYAKRPDRNVNDSTGIRSNSSTEPDEAILAIVDFPFSKFSEDPGLARRGGAELYHHWVRNSFLASSKHFAVARNGSGEVEGFLLHSFQEDHCRIELLCVSQKVRKSGVGTRLFRFVENSAFDRGCHEIRVGTQAWNSEAVNFYHAMGCRQASCNLVFHLWRNR